MTLSGLFGAGNEDPPGENAYDAEDYMQVSYQIDSGPVGNILCFESEVHQSRHPIFDMVNHPLGLDADCGGTADNIDGTNRLGTALAEYNADIEGTGDLLTVRIRVRVDGSFEEIAFDDITVAGLAGMSPINTEWEDKASVFALEQNYPNPFNPSTVINYSVANSGEVSLSVYNLLGQKVAQLVNGTRAAGSYNVTWNTGAVTSGMYYYRLEVGGQSLTRKMMLIK